MRSLSRAALVVLLATAAAATERAQVSLVDATIEADHMEIYVDAVKFVGHVVVHAERIGRAVATMDLTADTVTVVTGSNEQNQTTVTKVFALGNVHTEATWELRDKGQTSNLSVDCHRVTYIGAAEVIHLLPDADQSIKGYLTYRTTPIGGTDAKQPTEYRFDLTGRETADVHLIQAPAEVYGPGGEG